MPSKYANPETRLFYEDNAESYFASTVNLDLSGLRERFLKYVPVGGRVLDAGSGSGRDTRAFRELGYEVEAFDSSPALALLSTRLTGVRTQVLELEDFNESPRFDGIWACASLLHVSEDFLCDVLLTLSRGLNPKGALFVSFKEGTGETTLPDGRRFTNMTPQALGHLLHSIADMTTQEIWSYSAQSSTGVNEVWVNAIATKG